MLENFIRCSILSLVAFTTACSFGPSQDRVPVERRAPQPPSDQAPLESRIPPPVIEELPPPTSDRERDEAPVQAPKPQQKQPTASPAVVALLDTAREQAAAGQGEQAAASLERALRIEPKNPWLWHRLGVLRLQQGSYQAAIDLANKSNTLASGDRRLMAGNWELIARAYSALGQDDAAENARRNARQLQGETAATTPR